MNHTDGEWVDGNSSDSIVVKSKNTSMLYLYPESAEHYGGYLIAESVAPENKALIKAAPTLLQNAKAALAALSQPKTYEADIIAARQFLQWAIEKAEKEIEK